MRGKFKPPLFAVALQAASLLVVAAGLSGILIKEIIRHRAEVATVEMPSKVQLLALPYESDAKSR